MTEPTGPLHWYRTFSQKPDFQPDSEQLRVVERLQLLHDELMAFKRYRLTLLARTFGHRPPPRGVYLHGGVGRGKSALMDGFFDTLPYRRKRRVHFHEFMASIHEHLRLIHNQEDPLKAIASKISLQTRVLCFDEFHVSDIADAMILQRLFDHLITEGVVLVITSNYAPDDLYPNGLQRERFLPAIELLKAHLDVLHVTGDMDHRLREQEQLASYFYPLNEMNETALTDAFRSYSPIPTPAEGIEIQGRFLPVLGMGEGVVWFDFQTLCGAARSQRDYLELGAQFYVVLLSQVPIMTPAQKDAARRFTWLVDIFYDQRVKLLLTAAAPPEMLYPEGVLSGEFKRTVSRLQEMQSADYQATFKR